MLFDLLWGDINRLDVPFLEELTGIVKPEDAVQYSNDGKYSVWEKKVEARIRSYSWRQLARLATLYRSKDTDKQLRFAKNFDRSGNHGEFDWSARAQWLRKVQDLFGYQLDEVEVQALEWGKEKAGTKRNPGNDVDTVTGACRDCRQSVVGGEGWDGRCGDCADRVEAAAGGGE